MGIRDKEVDVLLVHHDVELDSNVVICSTCNINDDCIKNVAGEEDEYKALDTDHHGHLIREADRERIQRCREKLLDVCIEVAAWMILRRNMNIGGGWVNGILAVVTSMHPNCIVIANPSHRYPVPRFCQRTASYSILCQQFPLHSAYGGSTLCSRLYCSKAIVCLGLTLLQLKHMLLKAE